MVVGGRGWRCDRDADAAGFVDAESLDLGGQIERSDRCASSDVVRGQQVRRDEPDNLEFDPVGVLRVEALGGPVVACSDERTSVPQHAGEPLQIAERVDFPRQVVQPDGRTTGVGRSGARADLEQPEVVVVRGIGRLQEGSARELAHDAEAERAAVERHGRRNVADVEHSVVESVNTHRVGTT